MVYTRLGMRPICRRWSLGLMVVLLAGLFLATVRPQTAQAQRFKSGYYEGETREHCPAFAVSAGICEEGSRLPVSFVLTPTQITDIRVMVVEHCEDGLQPRIAIVELPGSFPLKREWGPVAGVRRVFDSQPGLDDRERNGILGAVWPGGGAHGYISTLSKVADDTYCYAFNEWWAKPQVQPDSRKWPAIPAEPAEPDLEPGLLQTCIAAALEPPLPSDPLRMVHAGIWPHTGFHYEQEVHGSFSYPAMPEACAARYARTSHADVQMLKKGRWVTIWGWAASADDYGGKSQVDAFHGGHQDIPARTFEYNNCEGHHFHKVRIRVTTKLTRPALLAVQGARHWNYPAAVEGSCSAAAVSGRRVQVLQHELFGTPLP